MTDSASHSPDPGPEPEEFSRRACDQCRLRKVRCDRRIPCSNCTLARQRCYFTGAGQKPKEARQRVLISTQYERKVDLIEHRLDKIDDSLQTIVQSQNRIELAIASQLGINHLSVGGAAVANPFQPSHSDSPNPRTQDEDLSRAVSSSRTLVDDSRGAGTDSNSFEGSSSVAAHATFAREFLENVVGGHPPLQHAGSNLRSAVSSLWDLLEKPKSNSGIRLPHAKPLGEDGLRGLQLPPLEAVVTLLRELRKGIPATFTLLCALTSVDYFVNQCQKVFFATEDFSQATFLTVNTGLFYIFQEKSELAMHSNNSSLAESHRAYGNMCRDNIETVLANMNMLVPARKENIEALVMGASYAIEISKPSLAWLLNTTACQLAVTLGYHRSVKLKGEDDVSRNQRAVLFWSAYIFDKALALRLGRPSALQDYDITLPRKIQPLSPELDCHRETLQSWLVHAEIQGRIYEDLYSPEALQRPVEQRVRSAHHCANILLTEAEKLRVARHRTEHDAADGKVGSPGITSDTEIATMLSRSDEVALLSSVVLAYRTIPPKPPPGYSRGISTTFCHECVSVARQVMEMHMECCNKVEASPSLAPVYMHWTILFSPFIPFIVLFCYVIESSQIEDLRYIHDFMTSLEPWRELSDHVDHLFRLCRVLYDVAYAYVEAKQASSQSVMAGQNSEGFVDLSSASFLNQLGFLPGQDLMSLGPNSNSASGMDLDVSQIGDWFSGYTSIMGLSEFSPPQ